MNRRFFLASLGSVFFVPSVFAQTFEGDDNPLIIRENIEGVDPRYIKYATQGPYVFPSSPVMVKGKGFDYYVYSPRAVKKPRLVVFSHGALSDPQTYKDLLWQWASHGFIIVAPLHRDSIIEGGPTLRKAGEHNISDWPIAALLEDPVAWQERAEACVNVFDDIDIINKAIDVEIDIERPIIAGHGYGAYIAQMLLGSVVKDGFGKEQSFHEPRFFGGIMMSPQGPGVMGLYEESWKNISAPCLFLIAENENDFTGQPAMQKAKSYLLSKPGYKHMGFLKGVGANVFTGNRSKTNQTENKSFEILKAVSTCFLLAYGSYNTDAFTDMTNDFFERMTLGLIDEGRR